MQINEKALEAARIRYAETAGRACVGAGLEDAIRAYIEAATPPDVARLADNIDALLGLKNPVPPIPYLARGLLADAATALRLSAGGGVPEGWKLVPVDPTWEMKIAGRDAIIDASDDDNLDLSTNDADACYRAMLTASPTVEAGHVE